MSVGLRILALSSGDWQVRVCWAIGMSGSTSLQSIGVQSSKKLNIVLLLQINKVPVSGYAARSRGLQQLHKSFES